MLCQSTHRMCACKVECFSSHKQRLIWCSGRSRKKLYICFEIREAAKYNLADFFRCQAFLGRMIFRQGGGRTEEGTPPIPLRNIPLKTWYFRSKNFIFCLFSCPGQLNRWHCQSVSQSVRQTFDFTITTNTTVVKALIDSWLRPTDRPTDIVTYWAVLDS